MQRSMSAGEWAMLLLLSVLWGGSFFFYKVLAGVLPPFTLVLGRMGIAAAALHVLLLMRGTHVHADGALWRRYFVMALLANVVPFSLFAFGETRIASGLAAIVNATTPLFTILVAHVWTEERITPAKLAGLAIGLAGVIVLMGPDAVAGLGDSVLGEGACLLAAATYGFAGVYGRHFRAIPPFEVATGQATAGIAWLAPLALLVDRPWTLPMPGAAGWAALFGIALLSTAAAYLLYFRILQTAGPTNLSLVTFLIPISALLLGTLLLGEHVTLHAAIGMALIGASLAAIDGRLWRRFRPVPAD